MRYKCALITVEDIKVSRNFYENILKQKVEFDFGENVSFEGGFAIHLKTHFAKLIDGKEIKRQSNNFELYFEYDNIDFFVNELKKHDVEFVHEAREQPWRQKVVRFYDPDKNIVEVGESFEFLAYRLAMEGLSIEKISEIIYMPREFVLNSIKRMHTNER